VNGEVAPLVTLVDPATDVIEVDGKPLPGEPPKSYYLLYKPKGYITTRSDPQGRPSVIDLVRDLPVRVESVGRLDYDTEGALLLTNDGELAHRLTHPSHEVPKRYLARVNGVPTPDTVRQVEAGVELPDGITAPARMHVGDKHAGGAWVEIIVTEGRNRLVRRLLMHVGHPVIDLLRESFAGISIKGLQAGETRPLTADEVAHLKEIAGRRPMHRSRPRKRP
jgi:pseudouridine synthase